MRFLKFIAKDKKCIISFSIMPILSIFLICYIYSKIFILNVPMGVVDMDNSTLSRTVVQQLKASPTLNVNYYTNSEAELEEAIKKKVVVGGIIIPKDFYKHTVQKKSPSVALLINGTNTITGTNVSSACSVVLTTINTQLQVSVLEGKNLIPYAAKQSVTSFSFGERILYDPQLSYMSYLAYVLLPLSVQMIFLTNFLVPVLVEEKHTFYSIPIRSKEGVKSILILSARILLIITLLIISTFVALCIVGKYFGLHLRGSVLEYAVLMFIFLINLTAMGFFFTSFLENKVYFLLFFGMFNLASFLTSAAPWPEYMMPRGFAQVVKSLWPFIHVAMPLKYLNLKGAGWDVILPYIKNGLLYSLFWIPIGIGLYSVRIVLEKRKNKKLFTAAENVA